MAKPIKIVLAVIGVVLVLVFGAVFAAAALFDPNDYRGKITEAVKKQTGRDLALGDIQLSVFPWLKVSVADVRFSNAAGFGSTPMAQVKEARVGVQLLPLLLHRQVQVSTVTLDGLKLDLAKDASGKTNWDDLIQARDAPADAPKDGEGVKVERIDIAGITLSDADIRYHDAAANQRFHLEKVKLETGSLRPGEPTDIDASLVAHDLTRKRSADLAVSATVLANMVAQKATVDDLEFDVKARGEGLDATARLVGDIAADLQQKKVDVQGLTLDFKTAMKDLQAEGRLVGQVLADLGQQQVKVDGMKLDFQAKTPTLEAKGDLAGAVRAGLESQRYEIDGLKLAADA
jgi:AsmA protein